MHAQALSFDGPRSPELVAASERAGRERIGPAIRSHPEIVEKMAAVIVMRRPDGGELTVTIAETEDAIRRGNEVIMSTDLLPGEDPALLPGPDRVEMFEVVHVMIGGVTLR